MFDTVNPPPLEPAAVRAIRDRLGYLEDNRYRYVRIGGYAEDHPTVRSHDDEIAELKQALRAMGR